MVHSVSPKFAGLAAVLILAPLGSGTSAFARERPMKVESLEIVTHGGVKRFDVEVADTPRSREKGLMFRRSLAADHGMLFDFKTPQEVAFWMKNTLIPLDMVFISADGRIVSIAANAQPLSEVPIPSGGDVLGVLELRGGRAAEIGARPGDRVHERIFHP